MRDPKVSNVPNESKLQRALMPNSRMFLLFLIVFAVLTFFFSDRLWLSIGEGVIILLLIIYSVIMRARKRRTLERYIESVTYDTESARNNTLQNFPLPMAVFRPADSQVIWALSSALVYDKKTVVLSVLGTYVNGIVLDYFIFDQNVKRRVCIITKKEEEIRKFIIDNLHSGATIYEATGAYNFEKHNEIITIVDKREYQALMNYISSSDPEAFITVYKVSDIRYRPKKFSA